MSVGTGFAYVPPVGDIRDISDDLLNTVDLYELTPLYPFLAFDKENFLLVTIFPPLTRSGTVAVNKIHPPLDASVIVSTPSFTLMLSFNFSAVLVIPSDGVIV